jgi:RNA polymerase sigma-70 factor (ECF subfamily)
VASDLLDRVTAAMDDLPEHYRVVVWLRDAEGLSYTEIAAVLDLPIGTVRSRLARARSALKEAVDL